MKDFAYLQPAALTEALEILRERGSGARLVAGGTDLLVKMKRRVLAPPCLVSLRGVRELDFLEIGPDGLRIGALTTLATLAKHPEVRQFYPVLAGTAAKMASSQVRNLATVGGNLCNAAPSADLAPPLIALDAAVIIQGGQGIRRVALEQFFTGPGTSILNPGEVLTEITLPFPVEGTRAVYLKHGIRKAMDIAAVGVAVKIRPLKNDNASERRASDGHLQASTDKWEVRVVLGAVAPAPLRVQAAETFAAGGFDRDNILRAATAAAEAARPIDDVRSSAFYRKEMVRVLVKRALETCWGGGDNARSAETP
ncbi:MAG: xanthine dehydrogenase family protein subunit M [Clostridia bacterium]|nr:xanthine dehydrogenase family protein subunit M [Clostridia bacterium]